MKKSLMMFGLAAVICGTSGCFTSLCCGLCELGGGCPYGAGEVGLLTIPLDIITSPIQLPFWIDYEISENCVQWFYENKWSSSNRGKWRRKLEEDFSIVMRNQEYLNRYDTNGVESVAYRCLKSYLDEKGTIEKLSVDQVRYVAEWAITHPDCFEDLRPIWGSHKVGLDLRLHALDHMYYIHHNNGSFYEEIFNAPCFSDEELEKIVASTGRWREQQGAGRVLNGRIERTAAERERRIHRKWDERFRALEKREEQFYREKK